MKIGIISDSHGDLIAFNKVVGYLKDVELLIHAGDILYHGPRNELPEGYNPGILAEEIKKLPLPKVMVKGNVDAEVDDWVLPYKLPPFALIQNENQRIIVYHGFEHDSDEKRLEYGRQFGADIIIFGHIHQPVLKNEGGIILLNPGSVSLPKQNPAIPTFGIIEENIIQIRSVIDNSIILEYNF